MFIRLSDGESTPAQQEKFPYVYIPTMRMYVREDKLDDLDDNEWRTLMAQIAHYQPEVDSGNKSRAHFMADRASRRAARQQRRDDKHQKSEAKTSIKNAKAEAKKNGTSGNVLGTITSALTSFVDKKTGGSPDDSTTPDSGAPVVAPPPPPPPSGTPWYTTPIGMIGIGVGALAAYKLFLSPQK